MNRIWSRPSPLGRRALAQPERSSRSEATARRDEDAEPNPSDGLDGEVTLWARASPRAGSQAEPFRKPVGSVVRRATST